MDGPRFDTLIKQVSCARMTRLDTLRGLAVSVAALTGMRLVGEETGAAKKGGTKRKWCHRGDDVTILGKTKKLTKDQIKKHKKKHTADYKGQCTASRIATPVFCTGKNACETDTPFCSQPGTLDCNCYQTAERGEPFCGGTEFGGPCVTTEECAPGEACIRFTGPNCGAISPAVCVNRCANPL